MTITRRDALIAGPALALTAAVPSALLAQTAATPRRGGTGAGSGPGLNPPGRGGRTCHFARKFAAGREGAPAPSWQP